MARVNGQLVSCDRCNKTVFLACTGEKERDGGFTRWNTFEALPSGWEHNLETGMLCPICNEAWKALIAMFMEDK